MGWLRDLPDFRDYAPVHEKIKPLLAKINRATSAGPAIQEPIRALRWMPWPYSECSLKNYWPYTVTKLGALVWSHDERIKLLRSKKEKWIADTPAVLQQWAQCVTTFRVHYGADWDNPHCHSWRQGVVFWLKANPLVGLRAMSGEYQTRGLNQPFEFKTLINHK